MANVFQMAVGAVRGIFTKTPGAAQYFADSKNWQGVKSSNLASVSYFLSVQKNVPSVLAIRFKDASEYHYSGVRLGVYSSLMAASSKGKFCHREVYFVYPTTRVK